MASAAALRDPHVGPFRALRVGPPVERPTSQHLTALLRQRRKMEQRLARVNHGAPAFRSRPRAGEIARTRARGARALIPQLLSRT